MCLSNYFANIPFLAVRLYARNFYFGRFFYIKHWKYKHLPPRDWFGGRWKTAICWMFANTPFLAVRLYARNLSKGIFGRFFTLNNGSINICRHETGSAANGRLQFVGCLQTHPSLQYVCTPGTF